MAAQACLEDRLPQPYVNSQPPGSLKFSGRIQTLKMDKQTFTLEFDGLILRSARYAMSNLQLTKRVIF
jgi:hypothetical protein